MPQIELRLAALVQTLPNELRLAEPLLFPQFSCLASATDHVRQMLARRVANAIQQLPPGEIYRHCLTEFPVLREVQVEAPPLRGDVFRREPAQLTFHYVVWRHGAEAVIGYIPALGVEVLAADERQLAEQLVPQIRSALARRRATGSLRELVRLDGVSQLRIKPLSLRVRLPTLKQAAQRESERTDEAAALFKEVATDLTRQPSRLVYEREEPLAELARLLTGRIPRSVLLVGPSGAGKTALVAALASRRAEWSLGHTPFWSTSGSRLVAGMSGFGMWQERCAKLVRAASKTNAIIHLGNLVELIEVGKSSGSMQGLASVMRPAIARGQLLSIAECTVEQLALVEREEPQLLDAFTQLDLRETSAAQTRVILARVAHETAGADQLPISPAGLDEIERLHRRFASYSAAPGRPLRFLRNLLEDRPANQELSAADVTAAFSQETGLPLFMLDDAVKFDLAAARAWFSQRVMGQAEPVDAVVELLAATKGGLMRGGKPLASLLLIGPTGVGKTELAKALAEFLYRDSTRMIRFDMSEFTHPEASARLLGGPYAAEGLLTQKIRDQPFMVVLLDEFEKAHPALFDVLLQVLGEGRLTDGAGRVADFTNAVVILTSNLGADTFRQVATGFAGTSAAAISAAQHFEREVRAFLRPEMFNRLDRILPFAPLGTDTIAALARREIERIGLRDGLRLRNVAFDVDDRALAHLAASGFDSRYGARPLQRTIERQLVTVLARQLCRYTGNTPLRCHVGLEGDALRVETKAATDVRSGGPPERTSLAGIEAVVKLRRNVQRLEGSGVILRLRNEIIRLQQAERQRRHKLKRRGKPVHTNYRREHADVLSRAGLLARVDELAQAIYQLENTALGELYAGRPAATEATQFECEALDLVLRDVLFELYRLQSNSRSLLTLAIFGAARDRITQLATAYEKICVEHKASLQRYWLKMHRGERAETSRAGTANAAGAREPVMQLKNRKRADDEKQSIVVDVFAPRVEQFASLPSDVIGVALQIRSERVCVLLETEAGRHEFQRAQGKSEACFVEAHANLLIHYDPPADVGRASAFRDLTNRRIYDLANGRCYDERLAADLPLRTQAFDDTIIAATTQFLAKRVWSLLD